MTVVKPSNLRPPPETPLTQSWKFKIRSLLPLALSCARSPRPSSNFHHATGVPLFCENAGTVKENPMITAQICVVPSIGRTALLRSQRWIESYLARPLIFNHSLSAAEYFGFYRPGNE